MRGTFANVRLRNQLAPEPKVAGQHFSPAEQMTIFDASMRYQQGNTPLVVIAGSGIRNRFITGLGREGNTVTGCQGRLGHQVLSVFIAPIFLAWVCCHSILNRARPQIHLVWTGLKPIPSPVLATALQICQSGGGKVRR